MLLVEKQIRPNTFAQIKRYRKYDEYDNEIGFEYSVLLVVKDTQVSIQRNGKVSRYASYDTLRLAQAFFTKRFGEILPKHLRGSAKANYLNKLQSKADDSDSVTEHAEKFNKGLVSHPESKQSQVKTTKNKPIGVLDKIRTQVQECRKENYNRNECEEYLRLEGFKKASITRVLNEIYGKVEKSKKRVSIDTPIQPSATAPKPRAPKQFDLRDKLMQARSDWNTVHYDVDKDLQKFQSRKFTGKKSIEPKYQHAKKFEVA